MRSLGVLRARRRPLPPPAAAPGDVLAETESVSVRLGDRQLLTDVDVRVRAGEVLALVGPNGAGKSTLLSVLAADLPPAAGSVRIHGRDAAEWSAPELALRRAVLPQSATLSFPFTVADVVRMGRAPWTGARPEEDETAVAEAMAATEVTAFAGGDAYGIGYGIYNTAWGVGLLSGPALGGWLFDRIGFGTLMTSWATVVVVATAVIAVRSASR